MELLIISKKQSHCLKLRKRLWVYVNMIPDIEIFSVWSEPRKRVVTWAFNNLALDKISVMPVA
jgi:hypothetical protein